MTTIIGYTDSISECDCCGKKELKGTYCVDVDGVEFYFGSVCAFKNHGLTIEEQNQLRKNFTKELKNKMLYSKYIEPIKNALKVRLENSFTLPYERFDELPKMYADHAKKTYNDIIKSYESNMEYMAKKYKIIL